MGFREQKESTSDGSELVEVVLAVLCDQNASNRERMAAATWLADRGYGKTCAMLVGSSEEARKWHNLGVMVVNYSSEVNVLMDGYKSAVSEIRKS